jgi:hypothetical protein
MVMMMHNGHGRVRRRLARGGGIACCWTRMVCACARHTHRELRAPSCVLWSLKGVGVCQVGQWVLHRAGSGAPRSAAVWRSGAKAEAAHLFVTCTYVAGRRPKRGGRIVTACVQHVTCRRDACVRCVCTDRVGLHNTTRDRLWRVAALPASTTHCPTATTARFAVAAAATLPCRSAPPPPRPVCPALCTQLQGITTAATGSEQQNFLPSSAHTHLPYTHTWLPRPRLRSATTTLCGCCAQNCAAARAGSPVAAVPCRKTPRACASRSLGTLRYSHLMAL